MLGPVYYSDPSITSVNKIPYYDDHHLFIFDFARSLIHDVALNDTGGVAGIERFWDQTTSSPITNPIYLKVGAERFIFWIGATTAPITTMPAKAIWCALSISDYRNPL